MVRPCFRSHQHEVFRALDGAFWVFRVGDPVEHGVRRWEGSQHQVRHQLGP